MQTHAARHDLWTKNRGRFHLMAAVTWLKAAPGLVWYQHIVCRALLGPLPDDIAVHQSRQPVQKTPGVPLAQWIIVPVRFTAG